MFLVRTLLRGLLTAFVAAACAAQPLAFDVCRAACDTARSARIAAAPPCHHASSGGSQISQPARSCSQDHAVVPADPGATGPAPAFAWSAPAASLSLFAAVAPRVALVDSSSGPPLSPLAIASNTPLRL
jgi:hypothetical protein